MRRNREPAKRSQMVSRAQLKRIIDEAEEYEEDGDDYFENAFDPEAGALAKEITLRTPGVFTQQNKTLLRPLHTPGSDSLFIASACNSMHVS